MVCIIWSFLIRPEYEERFASIYGPRGDWARLFAKSPGYHGTQLLKDSSKRYVTIDNWDSVADFDRFKQQFGDEYRALDALCEPLTQLEEKIGVFEVVE
jgi:heme-degrading monooxygenase HmoA